MPELNGRPSLGHEDLVSQLTASERGDSTLAILAAAASAAPVLGGPLAALFGEVRHRRDRRAAEFLADFIEAVDRSIAEIDTDFVRSSSYADLFERALDEMTQARNAEKRRFYATALATAAAVSRPDDDEIALLMDALDSVLPVHLRLLAGIANGPPKPAASEEYFSPGTAAWAAISAALPGFDTAVIQHCWEDLARLGILDSLVNVIADARTSTALHRVITSFGHRFLEFISVPEEA